MDDAPQLGRKTCSGQTGEGLVHNGHRTNLFLGEFVGTLEVVDLNLAGVIYRLEILRLRATGTNGGEKLVNFVLRQNFIHIKPLDG